MYAALGPAGWIAIARSVRAGAALSVGAPLHGVRAADAGQTVTALSGALFGAELALAGAF